MEREEQPQQPIVEPIVDPTEGGDLFDRLRAKRDEIASSAETLIPVPGYDSPQLLLKYKLVPGEELTAIGERLRKSTKDPYYRGLNAALDVMARACVGIYVNHGNGYPPQALTINGEPAMLSDPEFAERMKIEAGDPPSVRKVLRELFTNNDVAIGQHSFKLQRWMGDTSLDVNEEMFLPGL